MRKFLSILAILLMLTMLLPAFPVPVASAGGLQAICVPWQPANQSIPSYTYSGAKITLKGIARGGATQYYWDYGDGSPAMAWTKISNPYDLGVSHTYVGAIGQAFIATLYVTDGTTIVSDKYPVTIFDASDETIASHLDVKINMAIDEGLWYLHKNLQRGSFSSGANGYGQPYGYWTESGWGAHSAATGAALNAFQLHGNLVNGDYDGDPYVETVQRAMNYLLYYTYSASIWDEGLGSPDTNGNGIGLYTSSHGTWEQTYIAGICMVALASCGAPNYKAPVGGSNVYNRYMKDIVQDQVDYWAWGQCDGGWGRGGWRYTADSGDADMSTTQWPVLGMTAAKENMGSTIPDWVYSELEIWLNYCENTTNSDNNGGYYYYPPYYLNLTKAGAGMICRHFIGKPVTDPTIQRTLGFIYRHWGDTGGGWDWTRLMGNSYGMYAIMKALRIPEPDITRVTEYAYWTSPPAQTSNSFDWYYKPAGQTQMGMAYYIVHDQKPGGYWNDSVGYNAVSGNLSTGWRILCLLKGVSIIPPVAQIYPCPVVGPPTPILTPVIYNLNQAIKLTGATSFSPDPSKAIVSYEWDLDNDGNFDNGTDITATIPAGFPAAGDYIIGLRVTDNNPLSLGGPQTGVGYYTVRVRPPCLDPVAVAGGPYLGSINIPLQLDGSASWDADGFNLDPFLNITLYEWDLDNDGSFGDAVGANPWVSWTSPFVGIIALKVTDDGCPGGSGTNNRTNIAYASVNIGHHDPVSVPGGPYTAKPDQTITLDGSGSYSPDGLSISYSWDLNNDGTFGDDTSSTPAFTVGPVIGTVYNIALKVIDTFGAYHIGRTSITVIANRAPSADAGPDQIVEQSGPAGASVTLAGSGSDPDGDALTFSWSWAGGGSATGPTPTVDLPAGTTTLTLTVTDTDSAPDTDSVDITILDTIAPVVTPPPDVTVTVDSAPTAVAIGTASASDAVGVTSLINNAPATFPAGVTTVTWTAQDAAGNTETATQKITVLLSSAPSQPKTARQNFRFDSVASVPGYLMEKANGPGDNGQSGSVSIAAGGSAIWIADQAAAADVTFTGGSWPFTIVTDSDWGTNGSNCDVEVGQWDGSVFSPLVAKHKGSSFATSGMQQVLIANAQTGAVTIDNGKWLAVRITNNDTQSHIIHTGMGKYGSSVSSPETDPGYPLPELATAILLGAGVLGLGGFILFRRRKTSHN